MSLTSFLSRPDVRQRFRDEVTRPPSISDKQILAPALTNRYSLVGTAFDYLFRFHLQRRYKRSICRRWIAETGLAQLAGPDFGGVYDLDHSRWLGHPQLRRCQVLFDSARAAHGQLIKTGHVTDELLKAC